MTRQIGAPDNAMWPIPTIARLAWAAIWLVFLGYPIADILGTGYSPTKAVIAWICLIGFAATYLVRDVDLPLAGAARRDRRPAPAARGTLR